MSSLKSIFSLLCYLHHHLKTTGKRHLLFNIYLDSNSSCSKKKNPKNKGGFGCPNLQCCNWSFIMCPVSPNDCALDPQRLQNLIYSNTSFITEEITFWHLAEKLCKILCNWYLQSPMFHINNFRLGSKTNSFPQWSIKREYSL